MSLQELPQPILRAIIEYIPDVETLCNLDCTCQELHELVCEESVWQPRLQQQWVRGDAAVRRGSGVPSPARSAREEYKRRHLIDVDMTQCISRLSSTTEQLPMLYAFSHAMCKGTDAMDICFKLWNNHRNQETQAFARGFLRMLHCGTVCSDMVHVLSDDVPDRSPGERLEEACILTTSMFQRIRDSSLEDTTAEYVKKKLHDIADKIKSEFTDQMTLSTKLQKVDEMFFKRPDSRFSGNAGSYYDYRNSLLDVSLDRRKAIPMTLALLYKFICRRLDILVEIVGLPGHIVVHVPALDRFVDVFEGGRHLSAADCANIVSNFGYPMQQSYLNPLPPELVIQRILNNIENCLVRHPTIQMPVSARQRAAITALRAIASNPRGDQLLECRHLLVLTWVSEACVGTDISDW